MKTVLAPAVIALLAFCLSSTEAQAEIYKYKKKNGTVVYTDKIGQLPAQRQAHYRKLKQERDKLRQQAEAALGKDEYARREAEKKKAALARAKMDAEERARRVKELDEVLKRLREKRAVINASRDSWKKRYADAKENLQKSLKGFEEAQKEYQSIAIKPSFTRLPGEGKKLTDAKARMDALEKAVDAAIVELEVKIPEEARKAGVPPGWVR